MSAGPPTPPRPQICPGHPVLEVQHLETRYGEVVVHRDVSLQVFPGEIFALVGGSGSGKSTLLHELILLKRPSAGSIRLFEQDVTDMSEAQAQALRRRYGMVFQQGALFGSLTVLENAALPLKEHTRLSATSIEELAALKLTLVGLSAGSFPLLPAELSGGMLKRAALARALALDPVLLLLDEPTAGLDPLSGARLGELLLELRELLGLTVLMVTHDLDLLWQTSDRLAFLNGGVIVATGRIDELSSSPDPQVAGFFNAARGRSCVR